jgi:integrase
MAKTTAKTWKAINVKQLANKGRGFYRDPEARNLFVQVSKWGTLSYVFRYKSPITNKARWLGLGSCDVVSLATARKLAAQYRDEVALGNDPLIERDDKLKLAREAYARDMATRMTFRQCADAYLTTHLGKFKNDKHKAQWQTSLDRASKHFADMPVADIDTAACVKFLSPIAKVTPETASRIRGRIEAVLNWAKASGFRTGENPASWDVLKTVLPGRPKVKHHASLSWQELPAFMAELRQRDSVSARALEFTILTASRTCEVIGARWDEIDASGVWTVPASRMKAKRDHRVPLCERARKILAELPRDPSGLIFPLSNMAMLALLKGMNGGGLTTHGFRATFKTWAREATNHPREVAEAALAHVIGDKVEAAYVRGDVLAKRARLMRDWCKYCSSKPVKADNVVPMLRGRK